MPKNRIRTTVALGALSAAMAGAPGLASAADVVIGVPNWPSVKATANIMKVVLEDNLGLEVELQDSTNPVIFEAMDKGSMHVHPEVWLPNQDSLFQQYSDSVTKNDNSAAAVQGICVNEAAQEAGFSSIADLADPTKAELLDGDGDGRGEVFIGATGWASTNVEKVKGRSYGYDATVDLAELDEGVAYSQLDAAQTAGKPWAGFCYTPAPPVHGAPGPEDARGAAVRRGGLERAAARRGPGVAREVLGRDGVAGRDGAAGVRQRARGGLFPRRPRSCATST